MAANPQQGEDSDVGSVQGTVEEVTPAGIVEAVLSADDHYSVLGVPRSAERGVICRAYVETAVKLHPSGNPHPDAERAFLRATGAWAELRSEESRRSYDTSLQKDFILIYNEQETENMDTARVVFAQAWHECLSGEVGSNMTEFAQVLSQAQQLVNVQPGGQGSSPLQAAASGLAVSVGLWAAGTVASATGFGVIGSLARRAALVQGVGQVAMGGVAAYQNPELRQAIDSGVASVAEPARACAASAKTAARNCSGKVASSCETPFALWGHMPSCLPTPKARGSQRTRNGSGDRSGSESSSDDMRIKVNDMVQISGLRAAVDLNGRKGVVAGFDKRSGRYKVRVLTNGAAASSTQDVDDDPKDIKLIKRENLRRSPPIAVDEFI